MGDWETDPRYCVCGAYRAAGPWPRCPGCQTPMCEECEEDEDWQWAGYCRTCKHDSANFGPDGARLVPRLYHLAQTPDGRPTLVPAAGVGE